MAEDFSDVSVNTNMTAGEILRTARTTGRRKREIPTIAKQLCIREEFLIALEEGDYTVLPETVYILGFARNYAMELGIDPDMIVDKIKKELGMVSSEMQNPHPAPVEKNETVKKIKDDNWVKKLNKVKDCRACQFVMKYWMWFFGGLVLLSVLAVIAVVAASGTKKTVPETVVSDSVAVIENTEPAFQKDVRERFGTENREGAEIIIQAIKESWVKIEDARGKTVFSRVLVPGDVYYVPSGTKNKATFGNAGGIDVWVRGTLAPKVGDDNTRKNGVVLDADALLGIKDSAK